MSCFIIRFDLDDLRLEVEPLAHVEFLRKRGEGQLVFFVICLGEIFNDRTRLPERDASVRVLDGGDTTVRVDANVRLRLYFRHIQIFMIVWDAELLKNYSHLPRIGPRG